jgi:DNA-binding MarR family transcriptional regulator
MPGPDPDVSAVDILRVFVERPDPAFIGSEIAAEIDMTRQGVRNRLEQLHDDGYLATKRPGERTRIWWLTPAGHRFYASSTAQSSDDL